MRVMIGVLSGWLALAGQRLLTHRFALVDLAACTPYMTQMDVLCNELADCCYAAVRMMWVVAVSKCCLC